MAFQFAVLLALLIFLFLFISVDEIFKRNHRKNILKYEKSFVEKELKLPKNIP
jgi:hypothetical protein